MFKTEKPRQLPTGLSQIKLKFLFLIFIRSLTSQFLVIHYTPYRGKKYFSNPSHIFPAISLAHLTYDMQLCKRFQFSPIGLPMLILFLPLVHGIGSVIVKPKLTDISLLITFYVGFVISGQLHDGLIMKTGEKCVNVRIFR